MFCVISGGNWNNAAVAGVWSLNLNNARGDSNNNVGFRSDSMQEPKTSLACLAKRESLSRLAAKRYAKIPLVVLRKLN